MSLNRQQLSKDTRDANRPRSNRRSGLVDSFTENLLPNFASRDMFEEGGQIMELDDHEIEWYRSQGYEVEDAYPDGGPTETEKVKQSTTYVAPDPTKTPAYMDKLTPQELDQNLLNKEKLELYYELYPSDRPHLTGMGAIPVSGPVEDAVGFMGKGPSKIRKVGDWAAGNEIEEVFEDMWKDERQRGITNQEAIILSDYDIDSLREQVRRKREKEYWAMEARKRHMAQAKYGPEGMPPVGIDTTMPSLLQEVDQQQPAYEEGGESDIREEGGWEYTREGDKYLTRRQGKTDWITAKEGSTALASIKSNIYHEDIAPEEAVQVQKALGVQKTGVLKQQHNLLDAGYYIGPKEADGAMGKFTAGALEAQAQGIPAEVYNQKFESTSLQSNPNITVPPQVAAAARGETLPATSQRSDVARQSLIASEEIDIVETAESVPTTSQDVSANTSAIEDPLKVKAGEERWRTEDEIGVTKGWTAPYDKTKGEQELPEEYLPVIELTDDVYNHVDDFIIKYGTEEGTRTRDAMQEVMDKVAKKTSGCLEGALTCNADYVATKVGATSIYDIVWNDVSKNDLSAEHTRYSVPSQSNKFNQNPAYTHNKSLDAWEVADALVGEGYGADLYRIEPGTAGKDEEGKPLKISKELQTMIDDGKLPLGALVFQSDASGMGETIRNIPANYTPEEFGKRSAHATTIIGFRDDGVPLLYDKFNRTIAPITDMRNTKFEINRITIPKGYENYTFHNLKNGKDQKYKELGFKEGAAVVDKEYEPRFKDEKRGYVDDVYKGIHDIAPKVAIDYNMNKKVIDKMARRVVGISAQETNFNNKGQYRQSTAPLDPRRAALIAHESGFTNYAVKWAGKIAKDLSEKDQEGLPDWKVEMKAYEKAVGEGNPDAWKEYYKEMRAEIPEYVGAGAYTNPSVGPMAIKNIPHYASEELNIKKEDLYGISMDESEQLQKGAQAALMHLVEDYAKLQKTYPDLTEDQLINLATVAYNNRSKVYGTKTDRESHKKFVQHYIRNGVLKDDYLTKVQKFGVMEGTTQAQKQYLVDLRRKKREENQPAMLAQHSQYEQQVEQPVEQPVEQESPWYNQIESPYARISPNALMQRQEGGEVTEDDDWSEYIRKGLQGR